MHFFIKHSRKWVFNFLILFSLGVFGTCMAEEVKDTPDMRILNTGDFVEMNKFLNQIFPVGTDRAFVEKMLIEEAHAKEGKTFNRVEIYGDYLKYDFDVKKYKETTVYHYRRPFWRRGITDGSYTISVSYDQQDKVISYISLSGPTSF